MESQGEQADPTRHHQLRSAPADDEADEVDEVEEGRRRRRNLRGSPSRGLVLGTALLVIGGCTWAAIHANGGGWLPGLGHPGKSRAAQAQAEGTPAPASSADPETFEAERYFPAGKPLEQYGFHAGRSAARQGGDCGELLQDHAQDVLHDTGCQGYIGATYTRADGLVVTSVVVLRFVDEATARRVAGVLKPDSFNFPTTGGASATPGPLPSAAKPTEARKADPVGRYLTVTTSRFADGHSVATADPGLDEATRTVAHAADSAFIWA